MVLICIWGTSLPCSGQVRGHLGAGIAEVSAKGQTNIYLGHSFAPNWSAECRTGFKLPDFVGSGNDEWQEHDNQFSDSDTNEKPEVFREVEIGVRYWPKEAYKGAFLEIGIAQKKEKKPFIEIGAGYGIHLNRHSGVNLSYFIRLADSYRSGNLEGRGITLTIDYLF